MAQQPDLPKRLPLVLMPENRDETTANDARLVNAYMGKIDQDGHAIIKRPGLSVNTTKSGNGRGATNWKGSVYTIFGTTLYKDGTSKGTVDATNGVYRWSSCLGGTPKLFLHNGVKAYTYDDVNGLVNVTDVNYPTATVKGAVYLDATMYVMDANAAIWGSALNDPQTWSATNKVIAQIEPDGGVALAKQLNFAIAIKQWTTEVFYDAANATGSPLGRVDGAKMNYGCVSAETVQDVEGDLMWVAVSRSAGPCVVKMTSLKLEVVSTKPVERLLNSATFTDSAVFSWVTKIDGHKFYVLTLKTTNLTLAYDLTENMWHQWTDASGNYFPVVAASYATLVHLVQGETNGLLYNLDSTVYTDNGAAIVIDMYLPSFDGGTRRGKLMNRMEFIADQVVGSSLAVRKTDDDYATYSNFRNVDLSRKRPSLTNCGTFVNRSHHFRHTANTPFRLFAIELQLDLCTL